MNESWRDRRLIESRRGEEIPDSHGRGATEMCDTITITTSFMAEEVDSANGGHWQTMTTVSVSRVIGISLSNEDQLASFSRRRWCQVEGPIGFVSNWGWEAKEAAWRILPCQVKRSSTTGTHPYSRGDRPSYQCFLRRR